MLIVWLVALIPKAIFYCSQDLISVSAQNDKSIDQRLAKGIATWLFACVDASLGTFFFFCC